MTIEGENNAGYFAGHVVDDRNLHYLEKGNDELFQE